MKNTIGNGITLASTPMYETSDYSMFKIMLGNRAIDDKKVGNIMKNIEEVGLIHAPIIVNEDYEIIDGQHRFEACKRLHLPVFFVIENGANAQTCIAMNRVMSNWKDINYIRLYAENGNIEYQNLRDLIAVYGKKFTTRLILTISTLFARENDTGSNSKIKSGQFKFISYEKTKADLEYLSRYVGTFPRCEFYYFAVYNIACRFNIVDKEELFEKITKHSGKFPMAYTRKEALDILSDVFNYKRRGIRMDLATELGNEFIKGKTPYLTGDRKQKIKDKTSEKLRENTINSLFA
jgi:hypothetical protein